MAQYIGNTPTNVITQTTEVNDLTAIVTWANVPDANITQSSVTQHQAALSITESQISDLQAYLTSSDLSGYATETYVGTAIANLVDAAPTTLDTLNELAAALGDDANFASTITSAIGTKLAIADFDSAFDSRLSTKTTNNLTEGTNLYYTDARVGTYLTNNAYATQSYVTSAISGKADTSSLATVATSGSYTDLTDKPTIPTNTNQLINGSGYITSSALSGYATETYVGTAISNLIDSAPAALDTLNELAAALGDDANFASTVTTSIATKLSTADFNSTFDTRLATKSTSDLAEGTNLYYTNSRVDSEIDSYITGGTGVTITSGEISIGQDVSTNANVNFNDLTLAGNLTVNGTTTTVNTANLAVSDNMIYLADGNTTSNIDIGFAGNYNDGAYAHAGLFRDASDGRWKFFDSYTPEPDAAVDINTAHASFNLAPVQAGEFIGDLTGNVTGNVTGTVSSISNHSTSNLSEGTNLYYTDARVSTYLTNNSYATQSYVTSAISGKADTSSLATVATSGSYNDLTDKPTISGLTLQQVNTAGTASESYTNITTLQFDEDSGFDVTNPSAGVAKVAMNSTFKYWEIDGTLELIATGLDTVNFVSGAGIALSANNSSDPKTFTISTDLKTINGNSIVGSGDLVVTPLEQVVTTTTTSPELMDSFEAIDYRSAEYFVTTSSEDGFSAFKVILVHDDTTVYHNTHSIVGNTNSGDVTALLSSGIVSVYFTATNASTQVKFIRTTISGSAIAQMPLSLSEPGPAIDLANDYGTLDLN